MTDKTPKKEDSGSFALWVKTGRQIDIGTLIEAVGTQPFNPLGIPFEQLKNKINENEGTITFTITRLGNLFDRSLPSVTLFDLPLNNSHSILKREGFFDFNLYHLSEAHGLRRASLDGRRFEFSKGLRFFVVWSPAETRLHVGDTEKEVGLLTANGEKLPQRVIRTGDKWFLLADEKGIDVRMMTVKSGEKVTVEPSAKEIFDFRILRTQTVIDGCKKGDFLFETTLVQMGIAMLVSGMETYLQKRFTELENEGWAPDFVALTSRLFSKKYLSQRRQEAEERASSQGISKIQALLQTARSEMSFQEMKKAKRSYKVTYGLDLDTLVPARLFDEVDRYVHYRHRIIHAAADLSMLNSDEVPPATPVFANKETLEKARDTFVEFVNTIHKATLK